MTQEDKELLLRDLCARLPYRVKIQVGDKIETVEGIHIPDDVIEYDSFLASNLEDVKPYLFPLSSMTEEQKHEYNTLRHEAPVCHYEWGDMVEEVELYDTVKSINWCYKNHIDINTLIPIGLANDATELNIY